MSFSFRPVMQHQNNFAGNLVSNKGWLGGMGKDAEGLYINLNNQLSLDETIQLLNYIKNSGDFDDLNLKIQYSEDAK